MNILILTNGYTAPIAGLGKMRELRSLSEKRITKAVRSELRARYGLREVTVSCSARLLTDGWHGRCKINGNPLQYKIPA
jgi:hypothetical protein